MVLLRSSNFGMKSLSMNLIHVEIANFKFAAIFLCKCIIFFFEVLKLTFVDFLNNQKVSGKIQNQLKEKVNNAFIQKFEDLMNTITSSEINPPLPEDFTKFGGQLLVTTSACFALTFHCGLINSVTLD